MDELDLALRTRLDALAAAVPVSGKQQPLRAGRRWPGGQPSAGETAPAGGAGTSPLATYALVGLLLLLGSLSALLMFGGSVSGVLGPIGDGLNDGSIDLVLPMGGDIACPDTGDDEEPCPPPSPIPTIDPAAAAQAVPLEVPRFEVTVDREGAYSVLVGTASLPNGVLTNADVRLPEPVQPGLGLRDELIRLRVLGEDGKPRGNKWSDGWHPGLEEVEVRLEFTVERLDAPVTLVFEDVVVR